MIDQLSYSESYQDPRTGRTVTVAAVVNLNLGGDALTILEALRHFVQAAISVVVTE